MDGRTAESAHPGFAEVIRQLDSLDAQLLSAIRDASSLPIATLSRKVGRGYVEEHKNVIDVHKGKQPYASSNVRATIDNLERLGLVSIRYVRHLTLDEQYNWIDIRSEYLELVEADHEVDVAKGILELTAFGRAFKGAAS